MFKDALIELSFELAIARIKARSGEGFTAEFALKSFNNTLITGSTIRANTDEHARAGVFRT